MNTIAQGATAPAIFTFNHSAVRVIAIDGEPWFVAGDIAETLGYRDAANMIRLLDDDEKGTQIVSTLGGEQEVSIVSESGMYACVLKSRKPEAKPFRKCVTAEVLPAIRKTGRYEHTPYTTSPSDTLTADEADLLRTMLRDAVALLPSDRRAAFMIAGWSKLKAHFGVSYRSIPRAEFEEAVSILARHVADQTPAQVTHVAPSLPDDQAHIQRCVEIANAARIQIFAAMAASAAGDLSRARLLVSVDGAAAHALKLDREDCVFKLEALPEIIIDPALMIASSTLTNLITASATRLASRMGNNRTTRRIA
jgi:prophage antirepressor-like protein